MKSWIVEFLSMYEYIGLFILMMFEPIMPIVSMEEMLEMSQYLMFQFTLHPTFIIVVVIMGAVIGALMLYSLGLLMSIRNIEGLFQKYEKWIPFTYQQYESFLKRFEQHRTGIVFCSRFIPFARGLICILSGMVQMRLGRFIGIVALGSLLWSSTLLYTIGLFQFEALWRFLHEYLLTNGLLAFIVFGICMMRLVDERISRRSV